VRSIEIKKTDENFWDLSEPAVENTACRFAARFTPIVFKAGLVDAEHFSEPCGGAEPPLLELIVVVEKIELDRAIDPLRAMRLTLFAHDKSLVAVVEETGDWVNPPGRVVDHI
jgi:hypothetical protein